MEAVGRLAGGIAHDFNNLLQGIMGCSELLLHIVDKDSAESSMVGTIYEAGPRAKELVDQLFKFGQHDTVITEKIDLSLLFRRMLPSLRAVAGRDVTITLNGKDDLFYIKGDRKQLEHLAVSLCMNLRDAMDGGGVINISFNSVEVNQEQLYGTEHLNPGRYVSVLFFDSRTGIESSHLDKLSDPFFTTKTMGKGSGLGLALAYSIVREQGGFITVSSFKGRDTTCTIYLPAV
ncbi:MAG: ATP-binding protein [Spirochaetales bacterium]|jgi:two-component system cell cycle sensor histidine kinase/response regulator CckA|nr:ATP-binding protein [Spirochaetales bacterium]